MTVSGPTLGTKRLGINHLPYAKCGLCGRKVAIGEVFAWDSLVKVDRVRCVETVHHINALGESVQVAGCWADKFDPAVVAEKKAGSRDTPVVADLPLVDADHADVVADEPVVLPAGPKTSPDAVSSGAANSAFSVLADAIAPYLDSRLKATTMG